LNGRLATRPDTPSCYNTGRVAISSDMTPTLHTNTLVIGSGPGGATVARGLAQAGRQVLLLERGADHRGRFYYGTYLGALRYADRGGLLRSREGMQIVRPLMVGGATSMYCGCAARPPGWLSTRYHIDLDAEVEETWQELRVAALPADLRGNASTQIAEAGISRGQAWQPQAKLMAIGGMQRFDCSANCMLGCRCGAKWNAGSYVDQACAAGAQLITNAQVLRLIQNGRQVVGAIARIQNRETVILADTVVVAAGGIGTPRILQASGIAAGNGLTVDTTLLIYGTISDAGLAKEPPMTWQWHHPQAEYMLSTLVDPWLMYPLAVASANPMQIGSWRNWPQMLGVMIKIKDTVAGKVTARQISKPIMPHDAEQLADAEQIARQLLLDCGARRDSIIKTGLRGTHPGSTARIGDLVDTNLQTQLAGLYICDASVFPEALARPTVLTIIGLGKRLVRHLLGG
jgi:choline dehydrogenase-like flavoprotein